MRILLEAHHPAHIHFFKYAVKEWTDRGDEVLLLGRDRDVMKALLAAYGWIPYRLLTTGARNNRFPLAEFLGRQSGVAAHIVRFRPDVVMSCMGSYAQTAGVLRVPSAIFTDSEHQAFNHRIAHPFATRIYTPECFHKDLGPKQRRYRGYHELAFLRPERFTPRDEVLARLDALQPGVKKHGYTVLRTSAFNTLHDIGQAGIGAAIREVFDLCAAEGPVFIVPEGGKVPAEWERYRFALPPDWFHDALAFARFVVTEGASTASECACLGVPAVYVNSSSLGYLEEQERRYALVDVLKPGGPVVEKVRERIAATPDRARWDAARERLLEDHVDVTSVIVSAADSLAALGHHHWRPGRNLRGP